MIPKKKTEDISVLFRDVIYFSEQYKNLSGIIIPYPLHTLDNTASFSHIVPMGYKEEDKEGKRCLECGDVLPYGRKDMRFCSPSCKNKWHYQKEGNLKGLRMRTIGAIDRNYSILAELLESGVTSIDIPDLAQLGYNFDCITSYHKVRNHDEYRCYDIKYYMSRSRIFKIERCQWRLSPSRDP